MGRQEVVTLEIEARKPYPLVGAGKFRHRNLCECQKEPEVPRPGVLFVHGTTRNQVLFYPRFHHIVLLSAPPEILARRLATRTTNPYGKNPAELAETLQYQQTVEPLLRASATLEVVTTVPVARVADIVLDHVLGTRPAEQS